MKVYLRTAGRLREKLGPGIDGYTREIESSDGASVADLLKLAGLPKDAVAFATSKGKLRRLDYRPDDGEVVTLQPPVSGG